MKLTMVLCDYVAVAEGKLYISGGGWNLTGPDPMPCGIAVLIEVPWDQTNRAISFRLRLFDEDGRRVSQPGPEGPHQIELGGDVEVGRPPGVAAGSWLPVPLAINLPPLVLEPGQGYSWVAEVDGETRQDWRLSFRTRGTPRSGTDPSGLPDFPQFPDYPQFPDAP